MMNITKVFLNTWKNYNEGFLGYGWMTPEEAIDFIEEDPDRDGGEWFIADIDNYFNIEFTNLEYRNVLAILELMQTLEDMEDYEREAVTAIMEYNSNYDIQDAIDRIDNYMIYPDVDTFYECMDELVDLSGMPENLQYYFDYDLYHRDCMMDAYEASNGVVLVA